MNGTRSTDRGLIRRERWPLYLGGMLTEVVYVLALTGVALVAAVIAEAIQ
ncbi:MAG: hypothetical protein ACYC2X_01465 [Coriobacteriia bacterium]|jgi:hypothetical protein